MSQAIDGGAAAGVDRLVVLLFTDVESSTRHWDQHPQHMPGALRLLDAMVENAVSPLGGEIVSRRRRQPLRRVWAAFGGGSCRGGVTAFAERGRVAG
jgi:hypothetical protein